MARDVEFTISAKDDFSATFGKFEGEVAGLRKNLNLPLTGPLDKAQQQIENTVIARVRAMEMAANKVRLDTEIQRAIFGAPAAAARFTPGEQASRDAQAQALRADRANLDGFWRGGKGGEDAPERIKRVNNEVERTSKISPAAAAGIGLLVKTLYDLDRAYEQGEAARKKWGQGVAAFATVDAMKDTIPGVRWFSHDVLGQKSLAELEGNFEAKKGMVDSSIAISDRATGARQARRSSDPRLSDADRQIQDIRDALNKQIGGINGEREKARDALEDKFRAGTLTGADYRKAQGMLATDDKNRDKTIGDLRGGADNQIARIEKERGIKIEATRRESSDRLAQLSQDARQLELERDGEFFTRKLEGIKEENREEQTAAIRKYRDALLDPNQNPKTAQEQYDKELAAIRKKTADSRALANKVEQREVEYAERDHHQQMLDAQSNFTVRNLRLTGKGLEAGKLEIRARLADRLVEIKSNLDKELETHKERAPLLKKQAAEDAETARRDAELSDKELIAERATRYRTVGTGPDISGDTKLLTGVGSRTEAGAIGAVNAGDQAATAREHKEISRTLLTEIRDYMKVLAGGGAVIPAP